MMGIELQRIEILRRPFCDDVRRRLPEDMRLAELGAADISRIHAIALAYGERRSHERLAARFDHGLRHFILEQGGEAIAWTWLAAGVPRYIDELCWSVAMAPRQAWVRDAFVAPAHRGRRLLAAMLDATAQALERPVEYFSDVEASNGASLRAHASAGFVPCASLRALTSPRLVLRPRPPASLPSVDAMKPSRRLLWLDRDERDWHRAQIA